MGFFRQKYWSGLPFLSPEGLPDPGIKPVSPALAGGFFTTEPPGSHTLPHVKRGQIPVFLFCFVLLSILIKIKISPPSTSLPFSFLPALSYSKNVILFLNAEQLVSFHAKPWRPHLSYPNQTFVKQKPTHSCGGRL